MTKASWTQVQRGNKQLYEGGRLGEEAAALWETFWTGGKAFLCYKASPLFSFPGFLFVSVFLIEKW